MSDDLISRKEALQIIYDIKDNPDIPKNYGTLLDIIRQIRGLPSAFDKEKVIEKIKDESSSERFEDVGISGNVYGHYFKEVIDTEKVIGIVEKVGIE